MASLRDIFIRLGVKTDPRGFQRATAGINRISTSAISLGRILATGAVAIGFKKMIDIASDIEETANKFGAVFGTAGEGVQKQLDDIAKRTGATNLQLQEMSSNIGALIKPALGSAEAAGEMATSVTELALDIASFNNVSADDALTALRSGLIGSAEPLQRFGVDTRIAALQLEALRQGISESVQNMTEGQRVTLRYAAIQRQLGSQGATGDATKTALGFANAARNLGQAMKETSGIIGTFFLKSVGNGVNRMRELVNQFQMWLAENRKVIQQNITGFISKTGRVIKAVIAFVRRVADATTEWAESLTPLGKQLLDIAKIAAGLGLLLLLPAAPLLLLITLVALLIEDFEVWRKGGDSVIGDLIKGIKKYGKVLKDQIAQFENWVKEHETGLTLAASLFTALAIIIGTKVVLANAAAIISFIAFKLAAVGAAIAAGAAWLASTIGLILTVALLTILIGTLIFLGVELVKLIAGQDNFFSTMGKGIADLILEWGGVAPAISAMLDEALRFWLKFFGKTDAEVDDWIDNLTATLNNFWDNIFDVWGNVFSNFFGGIIDSVKSLSGALGFDDGTADAGPNGSVFGQTASVAESAIRGVSSSNNMTQNVSIEVNASPGMNEQQLAEMIPQKLAEHEDRRNRQAAQSFAQEAP